MAYTRTKQPVIGGYADAMDYNKETYTLEVGTNLEVDGGTTLNNLRSNGIIEVGNYADGSFLTIVDKGFITLLYTENYPQPQTRINLFKLESGKVGTNIHLNSRLYLVNNKLIVIDEIVYVQVSLGELLKDLIGERNPELYRAEDLLGFEIVVLGKTTSDRSMQKIAFKPGATSGFVNVSLVNGEETTLLSYSSSTIVNNFTLKSLCTNPLYTVLNFNPRVYCTPIPAPDTWVNNAILSKKEVQRFIKEHGRIFDNNHGVALNVDSYNDTYIALSGSYITYEDETLDGYIIMLYEFREIIGDEDNYSLVVLQREL